MRAGYMYLRLNRICFINIHSQKSFSKCFNGFTLCIINVNTSKDIKTIANIPLDVWNKYKERFTKIREVHFENTYEIVIFLWDIYKTY